MVGHRGGAEWAQSEREGRQSMQDRTGRPQSHFEKVTSSMMIPAKIGDGNCGIGRRVQRFGEPGRIDRTEEDDPC